MEANFEVCLRHVRGKGGFVNDPSDHGGATNQGVTAGTLALPVDVKHWSLTTLRDRLVKIGAKIVCHGRSVTFQLAEVMISRGLFQHILGAIVALRPPPPIRC